MGLVNYDSSDASDSEVEAGPSRPPPSTAKPNPPPSKPTRAPKKVIEKIADGGKIRLDFSQGSLSTGNGPDDATPDGAEGPPPAKRARTTTGGKFSGFNSFLPAPKNPAAKISSSSASQATLGGAASSASLRPGVSLRTSAAPGFSRGDSGPEGSLGGGESDDVGGVSGLRLPAPKAQPQPEIPAGQKRPEDVKLVGTPLVFKPLSVARKPTTTKKKIVKAPATTAPSAAPPLTPTTTPASLPTKAPEPRAAPKSISLFSFSSNTAAAADDEPTSTETSSYDVYEPLFPTHTSAETETADDGSTAPYDYSYDTPHAAMDATTGPAGANSLDTVATSMNLTAAQRRELFGRGHSGSGGTGGAAVRRVNMGAEYDHNEKLRASGEMQPSHNPVRAIQPGKHNIRQLVSMVHNQKEALEESFARGKDSKKEASSRYGW